jgi:hypothetical protein
MCPAQRRQAWLAQSADVRGWKGVTFSIRGAEGGRQRAKRLAGRPKTNRAAEMAASDQAATSIESVR